MERQLRYVISGLSVGRAAMAEEAARRAPHGIIRGPWLWQPVRGQTAAAGNILTLLNQGEAGFRARSRSLAGARKIRHSLVVVAVEV